MLCVRTWKARYRIANIGSIPSWWFANRPVIRPAPCRTCVTWRPPRKALPRARSRGIDAGKADCETRRLQVLDLEWNVGALPGRLELLLDPRGFVVALLPVQCFGQPVE